MHWGTGQRSPLLLASHVSGELRPWHIPWAVTHNGQDSSVLAAWWTARSGWQGNRSNPVSHPPGLLCCLTFLASQLGPTTRAQQGHGAQCIGRSSTWVPWLLGHISDPGHLIIGAETSDHAHSPQSQSGMDGALDEPKSGRQPSLLSQDCLKLHLSKLEQLSCFDHKGPS